METNEKLLKMRNAESTAAMFLLLCYQQHLVIAVVLILLIVIIDASNVNDDIYESVVEYVLCRRK